MRAVVVHFLAAISAACAAPRAPDKDGADALVGPVDAAFSLPGFAGRDWLLHLPARDDDAALPLVVALHGGGGNKESVERTACPDGDRSSDGCLSAVADREGFAVVAPDGTDGQLVGRSWHAGGGADGFRCVGGQACKDDIDDVAYVDALLAEVRRAVHVDDARIYATGISNGGAMSHRLACDRADVFAAIAAVAGANQADASPGCAPVRPIPVLQVHGTEDPCWGLDGTTTADLCKNDGAFVAVPATMDGWRVRNGCTGTVERALPDDVDDGTSSVRIDGTGCAAATSLIRIDGGGHTWPGGHQYLGVDAIGRVARDFSGNEVVWEFFAAHPRE
jgi:polyhydroxybutyrate depolymerase